MDIIQFLNEFRDYLISVNFHSAKPYRKHLENIYNEFNSAKGLLDKLVNEKDNLKQLRFCFQLIERIYYAKEIEKDAVIKSKYGDWHSVVMKLVDFIQSRVVVLPKGYLFERNISAIWDGEIGLTMKNPYTPPCQGADYETTHITYADNVLLEEQVPQLCGALEGEYERLLGFARKIFGSWVDSLQPRRIPVILKKECPAKIYLNDDEYVTRKINELIEHGEHISVEETAKLLRYEMRVCGLFVSEPEPHIEIYFNQFKASSREEYLAKIAQTLAHEYAHYLEYVYCTRKGKAPLTSKNISEAIADFFGVLYSLYRNQSYDLNIAKDRYESWVKRYGSGWPYAYALCFVKHMPHPFHTELNDYYIYKCVDKLLDVFASTTDPDIAIAKLVK